MTNRDRVRALLALLGDHYPAYCAGLSNPARLTAPLVLPEDENKWTDEARAARAYFQKLESLSDVELISKAAEEQRLKAEREEERREQQFPFNKMEAMADAEVCDYWCKASYWTPEDAVALALGRNPKLVTRKSVHVYQHMSKFATAYLDLERLVDRACSTLELSPRMTPQSFENWAGLKQISLPEDLKTALRNRGASSVDWKTAYEQEKARNAELGGMIEEMRRAKSATPAQSIATRERDSLLKLVIGMALGYYGYDPTATRTTTSREIANDLQKYRLSLDEDTIRKYLNEAKELLPPKESE
jgi:hypothetical protein